MEIKKASEYSVNNMSELDSSKLAGCYYCKSIFSTDEIEEAIDDGKQHYVLSVVLTVYFLILQPLKSILKH